MKRILLIGPQGSGKSTQAKLLSEYLELPYVSTGEIFRRITALESDEGGKIKQILSSGRLVDDKTTSEIVKKRISQDDCKDGFIMDGYPRNIKQLQLFDPGFDKVFFLKITDEEILKRLSLRAREDDTPKLIKTRLNLYNKVTAPLIEYYRNKNILVEIDGIQDINKIQKNLRSYFN